MKNLMRCVLAIALILGFGPQAWADFSLDQAPTEFPMWPAGPGDPGDIVMPGVAPAVDDGDVFPGGTPSTLAVPLVVGGGPGTLYDTDGVSFIAPNDPFVPNAGSPPGVLVSIDDGDIGPGMAPPDNAVELWYSPLPPIGASFATKATEAFLGLLADPPPINLDDDIDAYEEFPLIGGPGAFFSADWDAPAGLDPGDIYFSPFTGAPPALVCDDVTQMLISPSEAIAVDVDAVHLVPPAVCLASGLPGGGLCFLFSVDNAPPPPGPLGIVIDPGDIYITDCMNGSALFLDDVTQMGLWPAPDEFAFFDIDAISVADIGPVCELDGDTFWDVACGGGDCDDTDPNTFPGAAEICDGVNNDCSIYPTVPNNESDDDADGYVECTPWVGGNPSVVGGGDCNDANPNIYPTNPNTNCDCVAPIPQGTTEVCDDGQDNDCDGLTDGADPDCSSSCAGTATASVLPAPEAAEANTLGLLAFLAIPVAAAFGIVFVRRRR